MNVYTRAVPSKILRHKIKMKETLILKYESQYWVRKQHLITLYPFRILFINVQRTHLAFHVNTVRKYIYFIIS